MFWIIDTHQYQHHLYHGWNGNDKNDNKRISDLYVEDGLT